MTSETEPIRADNLTPLQQEIFNRIDPVLEWIKSTAISTGEFLKTEIPDVAYQYILYGRVKSSILVLLSIILITVGITLLYKLINVGFEYRATPRQVIGTIAGIVSSVVGILVFLANIETLIIVWTAPKVWLLREITTLFKMIG